MDNLCEIALAHRGNVSDNHLLRNFCEDDNTPVPLCEPILNHSPGQSRLESNRNGTEHL